ncbi:hypothetical protein V8D89_000450 [Ganoderma adspersum]
MNFLLSLLASLCFFLQLQSFVLPALASSHVISQRQSEFVDVLWSGRLNEPYLTAHVSRLSNSHVLCHTPSAPLSLVGVSIRVSHPGETAPRDLLFSRGPTGAIYGFAHVNASFDSEMAAASGEQLPTLSARYQRARKTKTTVRLDVVLTDVETVKWVDMKSLLLFTSAGYGRACM